MRVARLHAARDLRMHDEPDPPAAAPGRSLVRITSVGVCGSDLHWYEDGHIGADGIARPVVPGHEMAGVVVSGPLAGQRVAIDPAIPCGRCEQCRAGDGNLCPQVRFAGHGELDGALQELLSWPDHLLFALPDSLSDDAGALLEPLGVAIHAVRHAHLRAGATVLVAGAGPIGVLCAQVARRAGAARVYVSEPLAHRRDTARRAGADEVWDVTEVDAAIVDATEGRGVDVAIEAAGTDEAIDTALEAVRPGARIVLAGIPGSDTSSFRASTARRKGVSFVMSRRMHDTYPEAIALATSGLDLDLLVGDRYPLERAAEAFAGASQRIGDKTVISVSP